MWQKFQKGALSKKDASNIEPSASGLPYVDELVPGQMAQLPIFPIPGSAFHAEECEVVTFMIRE